MKRDTNNGALQASWASSPENLRVGVKDGEVLVRGEVDSKYDAEAIPGQIRRIPGVVAIDSELSAYDPETQAGASADARLIGARVA